MNARQYRPQRSVSHLPGQPSQVTGFGTAHDAHVLRLLAPFLAPYTAHLVLAAVGMLGVAGSQLLGPYLIKLSLDRAIASGHLGDLGWLVLLYMGNALTGWGLQYWHAWFMERTAQHVLLDMRRALFAHLMRLDLAFYNRQAVGGLMSHVQHDVQALQEFLTGGLLGTLGDCLTLVGILVVMGSMHLQLTLITCLIVPLMAGLTAYWRTRAGYAFQQVGTTLGQVSAGLQEHIAGVRVIQSLGSETTAQQQFERLNGAYLAAHLAANRLSALFLPSMSCWGCWALLWCWSTAALWCWRGSSAPVVWWPLCCMCNGFLNQYVTWRCAGTPCKWL